MLTEIKTEYVHYFVDENNLKHGEFKSYHENGNLDIHCHYINGKRHGEYKIYHHNGQLLCHCHYNNGKQHGEYKSYYYNGTLIRATFYYQDNDLKVNPDSLTEKDKTYILLSGRLPPSC